MQIRLDHKNISLIFDVFGDDIKLNRVDLLFDALDSIDDFKFIYKNQKFDELIKEQKKYNKFILVTFKPKPMDELKFKTRLVYNFLVETQQHKKFMLSSLEIKGGDTTLILTGVELLNEIFSEDTAFSPTIRCCWDNTLECEKILTKNM